MIVLLNQYKNARKELRDMLAMLADDKHDKADKKLINRMIDSTTFIIDWIEKGGNPEEMRGVNIRQAYHIKHLSNMDILPDISEQIATEREQLYLTDEQKRIIVRVLESLSDRERDCFLLRIQGLRLREIADELNISLSSVQTYIERADGKIKDIRNKL